jgi:membrane protein DedA with SNARE-associated domain
MMEKWIEFLQTFWLLLQQGHLPEVGRWNYILLAILVAVEGPIATLLGAAAASAGLMRSWAVFVAAATGNLTADTLWYLLGYYGKIDTALRLGRWAGLKRSHLDRLTSAMQKHALKILFFAKLTAGFMIPSLIATGLARIPWKRWFPLVFLGELIWTGSLLIIGYYTTEAIKSVAQGIAVIVTAASVLFLVVVVWQGRRILMQTKEFTEAMYGEEEKNNQKTQKDNESKRLS